MNFRKHTVDDIELNITPLIDVVFLLLIFFMVSTTFQKETRLQLQLPKASDQQTELSARTIDIAINAQGQYTINGSELENTSSSTVRKALARYARGDKDTPLVIRADALAPHQAVITAMDAAGQLGMVKLSLAAAQGM